MRSTKDYICTIHFIVDGRKVGTRRVSISNGYRIISVAQAIRQGIAGAVSKGYLPHIGFKPVKVEHGILGVLTRLDSQAGIGQTYTVHLQQLPGKAVEEKKKCHEAVAYI